MESLNRKLYKLEYKYGRFAISNLMIYICATMLAVYLLQNMVGIPLVQYMALYRPAILQGQVWRLITFIFLPPNSSPVWVLFSLYFYFFIGNALEQHWGAFKFNVYYLCGILFTIAAAMISGYGDPQYLNLSLFLAFAQLFPDTEFLLFFFIPVKAKYLAYLDWGLFALSFLFGDFSTKMTVLFAIGNFMLFFGKDLLDDYRNKSRYNNSTRVNFRKAMRERDKRNRP